VAAAALISYNSFDNQTAAEDEPHAIAARPANLVAAVASSNLVAAAVSYGLCTSIL